MQQLEFLQLRELLKGLKSCWLCPRGGEPMDAVGQLNLPLGRRAEPGVGGSWTNCGHICLSGPLTWTTGGPAEELVDRAGRGGEGSGVRRGCLLPGCPRRPSVAGPVQTPAAASPLPPDSAQIVCDPPRSLGKGSWEMGSISLIAREMQLSALITSNHFHTTGSKLSPGIFSFYSPSPCFQKPQHHSWCFFFSPPCIPFSRKSSQLWQNLTPWSKFGGFLPGPLQVGGCPLPPHKPPPRVFSTRQPGGPL